ETSDELSRVSASETHARAILHAGKVYIRNKDGSEELYDHTNDPAESRDLSKSSEAAGLLACFREQMKAIDQKAVAVENGHLPGPLKQHSIRQAKHPERALPVASGAQVGNACDIEELD